MMINHNTAVATALMLCALAAPIATAQQAPAPAPKTQSSELEEVVVTAQRRAEDAQHAAIAISTVSGDALADANVTRPGALTQLVPSLQVADETGPYSGFYARGVGNFAANSFTDPALTFNVDGVTVVRSGTSGFFYDLERVEVLKGPQGTLYGRNATGGAINVITKAPVFNEFAADAALEYGNYSTSREDVVLNFPIGQASAMRVAAFHSQHNGYMSDGSDDEDGTGGRLSYSIKLTDALDIGLVADYFRQGGIAAGSTIIGTTSAFVGAPTFRPSDRFGLFSPQVSAFLASQPDFLNGSTFVPFQNVSHEDNRFWGAAATVNWKTPIGTLTVIPAYRSSQLDYTSFAVGVMLREVNDDKQTSLEVRLTSDSNQRLRYVFGVFYLDDPNKVPRFDVNQQAVATFQSYSLNTVSHAAFSSLTFDVTPSARVTGGVRYTKDDKDFNGALAANTVVCTVQTPFGPSCPNAGVLPYTQLSPVPPVFFNPNGTITLLSTLNNSQGASYSKVTWRAGADWDLTDRNLLYASVETGFKSGGFFFSSDYDVFRPESITAYTVGSKNRFLENRLQLNLELFYWKYRDQQINHLSLDSQNHVIFPTENVGLATFKGVEIDLQARPLRNTLLSADVQFEDGVYDSFVYHTPNQNGGFGNGTGCPNGAAPGVTYTVDCSGMTPPFTPRWTIGAGLQQTIPLPDDSKLVGSARVHYQSGTLTALEFLPVEQQAGYSIWDFDLTYAARHDRLTVGAYVNNAFNKTALNFSFPTPFSGFASGILQRPRTYGIRAGVHF
jgi:iron complex outermembrane recepter protein